MILEHSISKEVTKAAEMVASGKSGRGPKKDSSEARERGKTKKSAFNDYRNRNK